MVLHPFRLINPGLEVEYLDVREISLTALSAALYAVLLILLAQISFGPIQLRIADCIIPLAALFGWPWIWGVTLGCFIGNLIGGMMAFGFLNPIDIILGSIANLIAAYTIFRLKDHRLIGCILGSIIIGVIVGGSLWLFVPAPEIGLAYLPVWAAMIISITGSSLIAIAIIGYALLLTMSRLGISEIAKSRK
ncbi:MAG TPA: QueT transporter family protein [Candidatus Bathyarchaeota archaeon]|nr:QueT transporter family protein [Candidatus Bathyarchaeota archaeon]